MYLSIFDVLQLTWWLVVAVMVAAGWVGVVVCCLLLLSADREVQSQFAGFENSDRERDGWMGFRLNREKAARKDGSLLRYPSIRNWTGLSLFFFFFFFLFFFPCVSVWSV